VKEKELVGEEFKSERASAETTQKQNLTLWNTKLLLSHPGIYKV
jgi:hypothetical protein